MRLRQSSREIAPSRAALMFSAVAPSVFEERDACAQIRALRMSSGSASKRLNTRLLVHSEYHAPRADSKAARLALSSSDLRSLFPVMTAAHRASFCAENTGPA